MDEKLIAKKMVDESVNRAEKAKTALRVVLAVSEAIREAGSVPSGHLYAALMGKIGHADYEHVLTILKNAGLVKESSAHLLTWIGPKVAAA